jgi:hypothetical protein
MAENNHTRDCIICGSPVAHERWALGYKTCLPCGEMAALVVRRSRTVVPMHKSNYVLITDLTDLQGIRVSEMSINWKTFERGSICVIRLFTREG